MKRSTILTLLVISLVLALFVTPLGYHSKVWLNQLFSGAPDIIPTSKRDKLKDYDWKLKDDQWDFFSFEKSKGNVVFINFWASWRLPCAAELKGIQQLYNVYGDKMDFYIITDEERPPVEEFMDVKGFTFPVTYLIIGERSPIQVLEPPASYVIDRDGYVVVKEDDITDWDTAAVHRLLDELLKTGT
ncbi:TlpA disulfide reductase family protein [Ulvibacterium sp.]|uniref:TlpA family protein disulfide reductase n=1 Tax=Ulvibacterium sp. TaxID=2665914 RepID=UPI002629DAD5|nr:TlpA disulfide reductase family protein [Ulvibacterium sp.]